MIQSKRYERRIFDILGNCTETSNTSFSCRCEPGWIGVQCETMINYCENSQCLNKATCRPMLLNYTCDCLGTSFSGRYCETVSQTTILLQTVSKSFAYVAILFLVIFILFVVIMDVLKYFFNVDPIKHEMEQLKQKRQAKRRKRQLVIQRFIYVA